MSQRTNPTPPAPNVAPGASQARYGQARWAADGVTANPLPKGVAQVSMRGGQTIVQPTRGDDVDLYIDAGKGKGEWRSGYIALTGLVDGEMGGAYDGEDVVVVCKAADYDEANKKPNGAEWPIEYLRLAHGEKPSTKGLDATPKGLVDKTIGTPTAARFGSDLPGMVVTVANFYRTDQRRGFHGMWADEGRGGAAHGANPQEGMTERQWAGVATKAKELGIDSATMEANIRKRVAAMDKKGAEEWRKWYFQAADLAEEIAKNSGATMTDAAIALAALSPKAPWGHPQMSPKQQEVANQTIAGKIVRLASQRANEEFEITPDMARAMNSPALSSKSRINVLAYDGRDPNFAQGINLLGKHKIRELPADVVVVAMRPYLRAMTDSGMNALMGARYSDPEYLGGPKTRSFYNNIRFPEISEDATVDIHMLRLLVDRIDLFDEEVGNMTKNPGVYKIMADALVTVAHEIGWKPHELQAALWEQQRLDHKTIDVKRAIQARQDAINAERERMGLAPIVFEKKKGKVQPQPEAA